MLCNAFLAPALHGVGPLFESLPQVPSTMRPSQPEVLLTGFADEAAADKSLWQQVTTFAALGLQYMTVRFVNLGNGIKNAMALSDAEVQTARAILADYGLHVSSLGSPLGKVKLLNVDDGTASPYRPWDEYLRHDVPRACELAQAFGTRLIRGFSFYPPKAADPQDFLAAAVERISQMVEYCDRQGLTLGLEVESNLVGRSGFLLAEIHRQVNHPGLVLVFDGANLVVQGNGPAEVFRHYEAMRPGLGWVHFKDHEATAHETSAPVQYVDEEALHRYVPAGQGAAGYERILRDLRPRLPELSHRLAERQIPGVFFDLEPHLKRGGQFGGYSGPDGLGIALRALCQLLERVGIAYRLR